MNKITDLKPYQLLHKLLHLKVEDQNTFSNEIFLSKNPKLFKIRYQVEFYFGDFNYPKDDYLKSLSDEHGWIQIVLLTKFFRMQTLEANEENIV